MVYVEYRYQTKDGKIHSGSTPFNSCKKAIRFIYSIANRSNMVYDGFTCDDEDELEYMNRRL